MYSRDAIYYDMLNQSLQQDDIALYHRIIKSDMTNICEAACGTGRILLEFDTPERRLVGIDLSAEMLQIAAAKNSRVRWIQADLRQFPMLGPFDAIICGYNSVQHILHSEEVLLFLRRASANLANGGIFILDLFNPNPAFLFPKGKRRHLLEFFDNTGILVSVEEEARYDSYTHVNYISYHYYLNGDWSFKEDYQMRQYAPDEMDTIIKKSGLYIAKKYGSYDMKPFCASSDKQIYVLCRAV